MLLMVTACGNNEKLAQEMYNNTMPANMSKLLAGLIV